MDQASGLHAGTRPQFSALIKAVTDGTPGFSCVLVYDTSRWGRFQDIDEGAYYEFLFKKHGVDVVMVSEQARDLDRQLAAVVKAVQRTVAAEHSRRVGETVAAIHKVLFRRGYWVKGGAPLGTKRVMVAADGTKIRDLPHGECKPVGSHCRTILELGSPEEVDLVKTIRPSSISASLTVFRPVLACGYAVRSACWQTSDCSTKNVAA